jgi:hypothetical protein
MACKNVCRLCNRLIISTAVAFTDGNLVITIPEGSYNDNEKYCIVIAQTIPQDTTINAPVVIQIGTGTQLYPLTTRCCVPVTACGVRTRTKYSTVVQTNSTGGAFRMLGNPSCTPNYDLRSINGTAPVTPTASTTSTRTAKKE